MRLRLAESHIGLGNTSFYLLSELLEAPLFRDESFPAVLSDLDRLRRALELVDPLDTLGAEVELDLSQP